MKVPIKSLGFNRVLLRSLLGTSSIDDGDVEDDA